ncbi:MAG: penicillin-binding protein 2 [Opitutales bacterium]|nr:penicillin-binding protein 2 [Opitutales bacterium]
MRLFALYRKSQSRLKIFPVFIAGMLIVMIGGLGWRQLLHEQFYAEREEIQHLRRVLIPAPRGNIFDREGRLLVGNQPRVSAIVYLNELRPEFRRQYIDLVREYQEENIPSQGHNLQILARVRVMQEYMDKVNGILGRQDTIDAQTVERHFQQERLIPFPLVEDLHPREYARLLEQLPSDSPIQLFTTSLRYYPFGSLAAHSLGYTGNLNEISPEGAPGESLATFHIPGTTGRSGLERAFDDYLQGQSGALIWLVDPSGFQFDLVDHSPPVPGNDLHLTLDARLQKIAEEAIGDRRGAVIALSPQDGEVLALASTPGYDLNDFVPRLSSAAAARIEEREAWLHRGIQGLYPPGSTFKMITAMAALRDGIIEPETTSFCHGFHTVGNRRFPCHNRQGHGEVDLVEAIRVSCNVFFYEHGLATGVDRIATESRRLHLDQPTGLEIPYETRRMIIPDREWKRQRLNESWFPGDTANLSIGQGFVRLTPMQMAAFTAALANDQSFVQPRVITRPESLRATSENIARPLELATQHREALLQGMFEAVETGTARFARLDDYPVAGKTGTAQVRRRGETLHMAWFIGFAPVENPEIAIAVLVEGMEARDSFAGGATAAPIAKEVLEAYFDPEASDILEVSLRP